MRPILAKLFFLRWLGLGACTILFLATVFMWVRSVGHSEGFCVERFEQDPRRFPVRAGAWHRRQVFVQRGRLWFWFDDHFPMNPPSPFPGHWRSAVSADHAKAVFETTFDPSQVSPAGGFVRGGRFANIGFLQYDMFPPGTQNEYARQLIIAFPLWMVAVVFGLWPLLFLLRRVLRRRRFGVGLCPSCGYDLRATPDRCPECGTVPEKRKVS